MTLYYKVNTKLLHNRVVILLIFHHIFFGKTTIYSLLSVFIFSVNKILNTKFCIIKYTVIIIIIGFNFKTVEKVIFTYYIFDLERLHNNQITLV